MRINAALLVAAVATAGIFLWIRFVPRPLSAQQLSSWTRSHLPGQPALPIYDWSGVCPVATRPKDAPVQTTLCEARRNPWRFSCHQIIFRATVESDCFEHSALVDDDCGAATISSTGPDSPAIVSFFHGLCNGTRLSHRARSGTFTGTFLWWHSLTEDRFAVELLDVTDASPVRTLR
jgi:hypothetical protein